MKVTGWQTLLDDWPWFREPDAFPIAAYSEFLPPPRLGRKPSGAPDPFTFDADDPWGWQISEYEEAFELQPGLASVARHIVNALVHLGNGKPAHCLAHAKLDGNPYWPPELAEQAGNLPHERYVTLLPLALSRTQDDKGRVRWTLFGNSEQGPARAFWRSFYTAPDQEQTWEMAHGFFRRLLRDAYQEPEDRLTDLRRAGLRILPMSDAPPPRKKTSKAAPDDPFVSLWREDSLPNWTEELLLKSTAGLRSVRYLLTFRPFGQLPPAVRRAYLKGELHLLPCPMSLVFWGTPVYRNLYRELPLALQVPLMNLIGRHEGPFALRVPQSGWMHEPKPGHEEHNVHHLGPVHNTFKRTHRWGKVLRSENELDLITKEDKLAHVLFSANPEDLGLYGKPMARNAQLWSHDFHRLLDGPHATPDDIKRAIHAVAQGGSFGYRFEYPAMRVGRHEVYWHRPLVAYSHSQTGEVEVLPDAPLGYLTAYDSEQPVGADLAHPIELWPRLRRREPHLAAVELFQHAQQSHHNHPYQTCVNVRKLLDSRQLLGDRALPRSFARQLLTAAKAETLDGWLATLPEHAHDKERCVNLVDDMRRGLEVEPAALPESLTYERTAKRSFEVTYWKTIDALAEGRFVTKNNADCVRDPVTQRQLCHHQRDLDPLGDYLLAYYTKEVARAGLTGKALVGDLPFKWQTDFRYDWMGGWLNNEQGALSERDLIVVIPGRDRSRAVIMGDHYDTAYMLDRYDPHFGGNGARLPACGADDNHSATAALMLGAPIFLELSKAGRLGCDIWLIHLTGEEFPADCLGARHLSQGLIEGTLKMRLPKGAFRDLSDTTIHGLYVLDMIAHNNDRDRDVFQIAPGTGSQALWLAYQAHLATEIWNAGTQKWNKRKDRKERGRGRRSPHGGAIPETAAHLPLHGEVRPHYDPRSTLYNTDGQVFSDAGIPAVLFMENYDINRTGYHDTHDTMANIDLDYGAALAAITIESVARAATEQP
jgi:Peptidase family M28